MASCITPASPCCRRSSSTAPAGSTPGRFAALGEQLGQRLDELWRTAPIPFRRQNGGDYAIPALTLRDEIAPGRVGFAAHLAE
ncbi:quinone reductase [Pseudomonas aeruginosa]|nr:quinone reductase [Pseudomonas aeruginosa]